MGPPLSPRETRRSGRRSAPSGSTSTSKSPDSPSSESAPRLPAANRSSSSTSSRKRTKQEDLDDPPDEAHKNSSNGTTNGVTPLQNGNGRTKRKGKEKEKPVLGLAIDSIIAEGEQTDIVLDLNGDPEAEEEEQGVTRCVCGNAGRLLTPSSRLGDDDESAGEFFVQCETCNVWQHGQCMGIRNEDAVKEDHYYCEQCRPDLHVELLKRLAKRPRDRHLSSNSHPNTTPANRNSRSHSPTHQKPQKRRNTMNSRDAAYDEMMALLLSTVQQRQQPPINGQVDADEQAPSPATVKRKRKRASEDAASIKRTRSASTTSDRPTMPKPPPEETPAPTPKSISMPAPQCHHRRVVRRQAQDTVSVDGDEGGGRSRASGSRRNQNAGDQTSRRVNGSTTSTSAPPASFSRTYSSTQQQQQPLLTSWGLPDYLAHLEPTLPSKTPRPLQLRGSGEERGVRVRWPGKRMSVGDMNKRVRALVEWVGREQASASERYRRQNQHYSSQYCQPSTEKSTMKMMEELMEELIGFQERFGPGAKGRERRTAVLS
ncbi:hypothetical protein B0F90DRAFT_1810241 [Multifurca ochricompacta]|uniref:Zinc finger PHD-type domain-containing protein n=1 Tax=Multifurca ochricompacta TaxID=376703 RepID=A0AAD4QNL4_9AGAM|nr:hypothetical protein B0F90DRAFT_1810241 [Multifurca ochricompacta]